MKSKNIPGLSLAVVREGKIVLAKGYGMANLELSTPANEKTCFVIYSITKTFTATATMILVEEGKSRSKTQSRNISKTCPPFGIR